MDQFAETQRAGYSVRHVYSVSTGKSPPPLPPTLTHTHTHINTTQPSPTHYQECVLKYQDSVNEKYGVLNFKEYHSEFSLK